MTSACAPPYSAADVMVAPCRQEAFGQTASEALWNPARVAGLFAEFDSLR